MLLTEINKLPIEQELMLSKQLFPKKVTKKKDFLLLVITLRRPQMKPPPMKRKESKLMTTKEEEPLQLPEIPKDSSTPKAKELTV